MLIKLRTLFSVTILCMTLSACASAQAGGPAFWEHYKSTFISHDGRVIDYGQGQASTSEGQGYGMLLAVINGDKKAFDTIWGWTKANLTVRQDGLMAWLWGKRDNAMWEVMDYNNATDGDTLIDFHRFIRGALGRTAIDDSLQPLDLINPQSIGNGHHSTHRL